MTSSGNGKGNGAATTKQQIIILLDQIRRDKDPAKLKKEQFPRLQGLVEQLRKSKDR